MAAAPSQRQIVGGAVCEARGWVKDVCISSGVEQCGFHVIFAQNSEIIGMSLLALRGEAAECITDAVDISWLLKTAHYEV